mgnify:FL=1
MNNYIFNFTEFINEGKISDFNRQYTMTPTWWNLWKKSNEKDFNITQDSFANTYEVEDKKTKKLAFIYDYGRFKIFTNETPEMFSIPDEIDPEELKDAEEEKPEGEIEVGDDEGTSEEGDDETNNQEEE